MKNPRSILFLVPLVNGIVAADECQPDTWGRKREVPAAGEIVCRYDTTTEDEVSYYTCTEISATYGIPVELFLALNPDLDPACENIKPNTAYCLDGFIKSPMAEDGYCGPQHGDATCLGSDKQCCNSETWQCGDTDEDCAVGTCYSGTCFGGGGHETYTLDGMCGPEKAGGRACGGKWGDCCNFGGVCGTGDDFCGLDNCESGNCTFVHQTTGSGGDEENGDDAKENPLAWLGTTPDGSCGGPEGYTCGLMFGACCGPSGLCGHDEDSCDQGCQGQFGKCNNGTEVVYGPEYGT